MTCCLRSVADKASRGFRKRVVVNDPVAAVTRPPHPSLSGALSNLGLDLGFASGFWEFLSQLGDSIFFTISASLW
uniref:Uncharacterized protein n=1 Tax=Triticum urartu TaxID=4572 RepID=A0A8R7U1Y6_TRIUA